MNQSTSLRNKLIYLAVIILMLIPLYNLGQPAAQDDDQQGVLTKMRAEENLAEASLGKIDPASESMKLASLGLRGPAALILWHKANEYKVLHEWDRLRATLEQISNLQPHFEKVWEFQAHNQAYNISMEFDDYRQRYNWVKKGTEYLQEGVSQNKTAPRLIWYTGWFYGNKMGTSDEKVQFRELFRHDEPFHEKIADTGIAVESTEAKGPDGRPDNWLVGRLWAHRGYDLVDSGEVQLVDKSPATFFELGARCRIQHATAIEEEGVLDDRSKRAWELAGDDWYGYGSRVIQSSDGTPIQLASITDLHRRQSDLMDQYEETVGPTLERLRAERAKRLTPAQREALAIPENKRNREQFMLARDAAAIAEPGLMEVAKAAPESVQLRAIQLASELAEIERRITLTNTYREQMNYPYWEARCVAEQDDLVLEARRLLFEAEQRYEETDLDGEIAKYEEAFAIWEDIFDKYPELILDAASDEVVDAIERYRVATDQAELPEDFPLKIYYELRRDEDAATTPAEYYRRREAAGIPSIDITAPYLGGGQAPASEEETAPVQPPAGFGPTMESPPPVEAPPAFIPIEERKRRAEAASGETPTAETEKPAEGDADKAAEPADPQPAPAESEESEAEAPESGGDA